MPKWKNIFSMKLMPNVNFIDNNNNNNKILKKLKKWKNEKKRYLVQY